MEDLVLVLNDSVNFAFLYYVGPGGPSCEGIISSFQTTAYRIGGNQAFMIIELLPKKKKLSPLVYTCGCDPTSYYRHSGSLHGWSWLHTTEKTGGRFFCTLFTIGAMPLVVLPKV